MKKILFFTLLLFLGVPYGSSYYQRPLTYPENKLMDHLLVYLKEAVDQKTTTRIALEVKVRPYRDEYNETEFDEFIEILYDEIALRSRYGIAWYARAILPTPVLTTPYFSANRGGSTEPWSYGLNMGDQEMIRNLVAVALPGTVFTVYFQLIDTWTTIYGVYSREIAPPPRKVARYIDSRFVEKLEKKPLERTVTRLSVEEIYTNLLAAEGKRYVRGGTYADGIPEMSARYPYPSTTPQSIRELRRLEWVDCSGLLYQATNGRTPRNTTLLLWFGRSLPIEGKTVDELIALVRPLDLIVRKGHTMIILNQNDVIESRHDYDTLTPWSQGGVRVRPLRDVLIETLKYHTPVNAYDDGRYAGDDDRFVITRWYDESAE